MDNAAALTEIEAAQSEGKLSESAAGNVRDWLTDASYAEYVPQIIAHVESGKWQELDDVFWTIIPFGTGGRRGKMYPIGSNAINDRTMGESAQGLADYVKNVLGDDAKLSCAIAYDTRHRSRDFAELCAGVMVANGFKVHFLDGYRSTPALSFAIRHLNCSCGIMITASHNPPSDNALKVYWSTGGQLLPPHDRGVIDQVKQVAEIKRTPFQQALDAGQVVYRQEEIDAAFLRALQEQSFSGPRDLKIIYSPLHGVGASAVGPILKAVGFE
ncbi:MAG: phospho-sugar mutase, partial [Planctomycetales bacterium]